jgi:hypothetical protein
MCYCLIRHIVRVMGTPGRAGVSTASSDPTGTSICAALTDGRAWTVQELAVACRTPAAVAAERVAELVAGGVVHPRRQGRHLYYRITDERVRGTPPQAQGQIASDYAKAYRVRRATPLARARTCHSHLAGALGVGLRDGMVRAGLVDVTNGLELTAQGVAVLLGLGIDGTQLRRSTLLHDCLDWTERREHFSGPIPSAILRRALSAGWMTRTSDRAIHVNETAWAPLAELGLDGDLKKRLLSWPTP